jgi:SAM-dependent methyltransferase
LFFHVVEHLTKPRDAIDELKRVLKKNGFLIGETPHWVSAITPVGYNFYDDETHIRPYSVQGIRSLLNDYDVKYVKFETPVFYFLSSLYGIKKKSLFMYLRSILKMFGLYRTAVFFIARKKR